MPPLTAPTPDSPGPLKRPRDPTVNELNHRQEHIASPSRERGEDTRPSPVRQRQSNK
ncbi:hypothetical protein BDZ85DRAFT_22746 [Elsinoe ampelina]|uniref:Uncharacterized protein n=1 Tax=Elsinoe ampelina TaxID=302913 RepID=A0A6A6G5I4_9PEZI|nr:hypothetical protein BDZ85DRAFT_22746 [Elsinoe ampelina]